MASVTAEKRGLPPTLAGFVNLWHQRWLIGHFIRRDVASTYKGSYLGFFWTFVNPLLMIVLYTFVFSSLLQLRFTQEGGSLNFGIYLYCGLIPYLAFSDAVQDALSRIRANATLVQRTVFPIEILPLTTTATQFVMQVFGLGVLVVVYAFVESELHWTALLLPVAMAPQLLFTLGVSYMASVVGTFVPDMRDVIGAILRALLFATPIIYPPSIVPEQYSLLIDLNPLAFLVEAYRELVLEGQIPATGHLIAFYLVALAFFGLGWVLFQRTKSSFADVL